MTTARKYLDILKEREPKRLPQSLENSPFTESDIRVIEKGLGYSLPEQYKDFLLCYKMPEKLTVLASFCGDRFGCSWEETFSREKNEYVHVSEDDIGVTSELEWHNIQGNDGEEFLKNLKEEQERIEEDPCFLESGFIQIGEVWGYLLFLDLVKGGIATIHEEEIYDMTLEEGIDPQNIQEVREYMECNYICKDFNDFLRLVCTGDYLDEDEQKFLTAQEIEQMRCGLTEDEMFERNLEYVMSDRGISREEAVRYLKDGIEPEKDMLKEKAVEQLMRENNISREEALKYLEDLLSPS